MGRVKIAQMLSVGGKILCDQFHCPKRFSVCSAYDNSSLTLKATYFCCTYYYPLIKMIVIFRGI